MQLKLRGYSFQLSEPFRAGTVITKGEAQALNDLRAENIGNNLRRLVQQAQEQLLEGQLIPAEQLEQIQQKITQYDLMYQFQERSTVRPKLGDIEVEARELARETLEAILRQQGRELNEEEMEEQIDARARLPLVLEAARDRVQAKRKALADSISEL